MKKKTIRITEEKLGSLIEETLNEALNEIEPEETNSVIQQPSQVGDQEPTPYLVDITDKAEMQQYSDEVYAIMRETYKKIGGPKGFPNPRSLFRNANLLTLYTDGLHIYSAAIYSDRLQGNKMMLIGGKNPFDPNKGNFGVEEIVKHNIANFKGWYWCEVSEGIEDMFKRNNGFPIPTQLVKDILYSAKNIEIIDDFHYRRPIGQEQEIFEKIIFGFNSEETLNRVYNEIDNYDELRNAFNQTAMKNESINDEQKRAWEMALAASHVINTVYENSQWRGMFELTPMQKSYIEYSIELLKPFANEPKVPQNIELGEYMLNNYPLLEAHPF